MANMVAQPWVANTVGHHWEAFTVDLPWEAFTADHKADSTDPAVTAVLEEGMVAASTAAVLVGTGVDFTEAMEVLEELVCTVVLHTVAEDMELEVVSLEDTVQEQRIQEKKQQLQQTLATEEWLFLRNNFLI